MAWDDLPGGKKRNIGEDIEKASKKWKAFDAGKKKALTILIVCLLASIFLAPKIVNTVKKGTYQIKQTAIFGNMYAKMEPGLWSQWWGDIDTWNKAFTFYFTHDADTKYDSPKNLSIEIRFVDGSKCDMSGTARVLMPTIGQLAINLVTEHGYANEKEVQYKLILPTIRNVLRMTANMMTAQESYSSKRIDFNNWARDQIENGLYQTMDEEREVVDPISGEIVHKTFKIIKTVDGKPGSPPLYMANPLEGTGITLKNFEIKSFEYKDKVKAQISKQQEALMAVATAITEAKKAEQQKLTIEAQGKAKVAQAKYEEEQTKVRAVVVAERNKEVHELDAARDKAVAVIAGEKRKEVAKLDKDAAKLKKEELILLGQGEATRKKLVLAADGALEKKLATYEQVMGVWAKAFSKRPVPTVMMGGGKSGVDGDAIAMSDVLSLMALKQLGLDLSIPKGKTK
jgi:regulator of protease activity HflC (stomatin/prohibitin superfamily)